MNRQCVRSGHCCKQAPCGFGEATSPTNRACRFLEEDSVLSNGAVVHRCGKYEEIKNAPDANVSPAFGAGCCQPLFNENRRAIIAVTIGRKEKV